MMKARLERLCSIRANEKKAWQTMALLDTQVNVQQALIDAAQFGIRYVLTRYLRRYWP